ncbi:hypothetical protein LTR08_000758 [Meristemomyces frigidus]|nr:hypothetical protein LTR08_000758 [Meristemomyces frigidus]
MSSSNMNINTPSSTETSEDLASSNTTPPPPPRPDGLTTAQALQRQGDIVDEFYIDHSAVDEKRASAPPVQPAVTPAKRKTKGSKQATSTTAVDGAPTPPKKTKPTTKIAAAATSSPDISPSRRSERNKEKKQPATEDAAELGSPLAKKKKAISDAPNKPAPPITEMATATVNATTKPASPLATKRKAAPDAAIELMTPTKKSKPAPVASNSIARMKADPSGTTKPVSTPAMSARKAGKLPITDDQVGMKADPSGTTKPVSTPAMSARKAGKLPVTADDQLGMKADPSGTTKPVSTPAMSTRKAGKLPIIADDQLGMKADQSGTTKPVSTPAMSTKKAGKLPITADDQLEVIADDGPAPAGPASRTKRLIIKLPKKRTPSTEPATKKLVKVKTDDDGEAGQGDDDDDDDAPSGSKKKGGKKAAPKRVIIQPGFVGKVSGMGTSINRPTLHPNSGISLLDASWPCGHRHCNTGMTWLPRDGPTAGDAFGRKTCSQFFGRNKGETGRIDNKVWHTYCRKCYQRTYYALTKQKKEGEEFQDKPQEGAASYHMTNLRSQFQRLELWRPNAVFKVQLTKNTIARSNAWHTCMRQSKNDVAAATATYAAHSDYGVKVRKPAKNGEVAAPKPEEAFPVQLVDAFANDANLCGDDFDYDQVSDVLDHIQGMLDAGTIQQVPPIEFLISEKVDGERVVDAATNYARWVAVTDGYTFVSPPPSASGDGEQKSDDHEAKDENVHNNSETTDVPAQQQQQQSSPVLSAPAQDRSDFDILLAAIDAVQADDPSVRQTTERDPAIKVEPAVVAGQDANTTTATNNNNNTPAPDTTTAKGPRTRTRRRVTPQSATPPPSPARKRRGPLLNRYGAPIVARPNETTADILASLNGSAKKLKRAREEAELKVAEAEGREGKKVKV